VSPGLPDGAEGIEFNLSELKTPNIQFRWFYIATNGCEQPSHLSWLVLSPELCADEKDMCEVSISVDYFHLSVVIMTARVTDGLAFFTRKHKEEKPYTTTGLIEGA